MKKIRLKKHEGGYTWIEVLTFILIATVATATMVPVGKSFLEFARGRRYVSEAKMIYSATQIYAQTKHGTGDLDNEDFCEKVTKWDMDSEESPLKNYLWMSCTPKAKIDDIMVNEETGELIKMIYSADQFKITLGEKGTKVKVQVIEEPRIP